MSVVDYALRYAQLDWPCFPIQPGAKVPLGKLVPHGVLDASVTPTITIQRNASISYGTGTATGSKVTVNFPYHFMVMNGIARLVVSNTTLGSDFTMATSATMRNEN